MPPAPLGWYLAYLTLTYLFLKDRVVSMSILGVAEPAPVHDHHAQGGGQEPNDEEAGLGVAAIEQAKQRQQQQQSQENIQVPEYEKITKEQSIFSLTLVFLFCWKEGLRRINS